MSRRSGRELLILAAAAACAACRGEAAAEAQAGVRAAAPAPEAEYSNVTAADYVGPDACGECHEDKRRHWGRSLHAAMNQLAGPGTEPRLLGDFDGAVVDYAGGRARFARDGEGGAPTMTLWPPAGGPARRFRITRTIGVRALQEYVGVQVAGPEPPGDPIYVTELRLPFGWWARPGRWLHRQYFDSWYGEEWSDDGTPALDAYAPDREPWAARCAWCHNTYPFELRALRGLGGRQTGMGLERFVTLSSSRRGRAEQLAVAALNLLPTEELVTVGISCESCHLGGREHAREGREIRFLPAGAELAAAADAPLLAGGRANPRLLTAVCAQCHSTPSPRFADGGVTRNSSEALDLAAGACVSAVKCTSCHDPHESGPGARAPDDPRHLAACTGCHSPLAGAAAARAHARHDPAEASCLDCHMPRRVQGVGDWVRSHRIGSPTEPAMLASGAPNACNLCHLDRSLGWTLAALERDFGRRVEPLAGVDLETPMGELWLRGADADVRLVAAGAYARSQLARAALPALLAQLDDPVAYRRMWMLFAVEAALGRRLCADEYDAIGPPATRAAQAARLRGAADTADRTSSPRSCRW